MAPKVVRALPIIIFLVCSVVVLALAAYNKSGDVTKNGCKFSATPDPVAAVAIVGACVTIVSSLLGLICVFKNVRGGAMVTAYISAAVLGVMLMMLAAGYWMYAIYLVNKHHLAPAAGSGPVSAVKCLANDQLPAAWLAEFSFEVVSAAVALFLVFVQFSVMQSHSEYMLA